MAKAAKTSKEQELEKKVLDLENKLREEKKQYKRNLALNEILSEFDFERVESVCNFLDWEVYDSKKKGMVPVTVELLKTDAENFARECWAAFDRGEAKDEWSIHGGPLKLWWSEGSEGIFAELEFVCESWRVEPD